MMETLCPQGHRSVTTDYCDQCGTPIAAPPVADGDSEVSSVTEVRTPEAAAERCPLCDTPRTSGDRYCEVDGYDFERLGDVKVAVTWRAIVQTDRSYFDRMSPDDLQYPGDGTTLTCELDADAVTVGRQSSTRGIHPDIDLGGTYEDPGVSRRHLRFERSPDGSYAVVDCGSANGTTINDDPKPIAPETPVPLADGDRVHLGAWTTITIVCQRTVVE
jgi:hypothetical protein